MSLQYRPSERRLARTHFLSFAVAFLRVVLAQYDPVNNFCRRLDHQSALVRGTLYIDGGRETFTDSTIITGPHVVGINEYLITVDMTKSWSSKTGIPIRSIPKPSMAPNVARAVMYADPSGKDDFYLFGGTVPEENTSFVGWQKPQPEGPALWSYKAASNSWTSFSMTASNILRPCSGASAIVEDKGLVFYYSGEQDNGSSTQTQEIADTTKFMKGMLVLDLARHTAKNLSTAAVSSNARVRGGLVHIPLPGSDGVLVLLGGGEKSADNLEHDWKGTLVSFNYVNVFEVGSISPQNPDGLWFTQTVSGVKPAPRLDPCFVVTAAPDNSSYNIYMYGGRDGLNAYYDELWILTLPSFQWILAYAGNSPRYSMTCHLASSRQMLVVGGSNTSHIAENCDPIAQGLFILDLTDLSWNTSFDANAKPYQVPAKVVNAVGGSSIGGATLNQPVGGFLDDNLAKLFHPPRSSSTNSTTQQPYSESGDSSSKGKLNIPAIAGGVIGGITLICLLAIGALALLRRRGQRRSQQQRIGGNDGKRTSNELGLLDSVTFHEIGSSSVPLHEKHAPGAIVELPASWNHNVTNQNWNTLAAPIELDGSESSQKGDRGSH